MKQLKKNDAGNTKMEKKFPSVEITIGMPLYNNADTLMRAVDSIRYQTYTHWKLVISDDCSADETSKLLNDIHDSRIQIFRQSKNLYFKNFNFVLEKADTPYFCWLAGDDYWQKDFLMKTRQHLIDNQTCILAAPRCIFLNKKSELQDMSSGTYPIVGDTEDRIAAYLKCPSDNSRMYGLFRTEQLKMSMPTRVFHAWDWSLCAKNLQYGEHHQLDETLLHREKTDTENYVRSIERDEVSLFYRYFPVFRCSADILNNGVKPSKAIIKSLIFINVFKHWEYVKFKNRTLNTMLTPLYWRLLERLKK